MMLIDMLRRYSDESNDKDSQKVEQKIRERKLELGRTVGVGDKLGWNKEVCNS